MRHCWLDNREVMAEDECEGRDMMLARNLKNEMIKRYTYGDIL